MTHMSKIVPVRLTEWREFLRGYSDDYLRLATDEDMAGLDAVQRESRWLGYEAAGEKEIRATEERLGRSLPPSYRNFLLASNGWRNIDAELGELLKVEEIGWFEEREPELLTYWSDAGLDAVVNQVKPCLLLSAWTDCAVYWLLDPTRIGSDGEWALYEWATGDGSDPSQCASFGAQVSRSRDAFVRMKADGLLRDAQRQRGAVEP